MRKPRSLIGYSGVAETPSSVISPPGPTEKSATQAPSALRARAQPGVLTALAIHRIFRKKRGKRPVLGV
jgi:hypothetical protein